MQVLDELKRLVRYYREEVGESVELLGLALSARKNLCIHPEVGQSWLSRSRACGLAVSNFMCFVGE